MEYFEDRKSSISSDDIEVPNVMKDNIAVADATDSIQHDNFDSWLDDTTQRRSPEGGEDNSSVVSHSHSIEPEVYSEKVITIRRANQFHRCDMQFYRCDI